MDSKISGGLQVDFRWTSGDFICTSGDFRKLQVITRTTGYFRDSRISGGLQVDFR